MTFAARLGLIRFMASIALLGIGASGVIIAVYEIYAIYAVYSSTDPMLVLIIAAILINSLISCWLGMKILIFRRHLAVSIDPPKKISRRTVAAKSLGMLLIVTGASAILYIMYGVYVVYKVRSVLPWTDDMDTLAPFLQADVLITSVTACWVGARLAHGRKAVV